MRTLPFPLFYRLSRFRFFDFFFRKRRDSIRYDKKPTSAASKAISHQPTFRTKKIIKLTLGIREIICQVYESLCMSGRGSFKALGARAPKAIVITMRQAAISRGKGRCTMSTAAEFRAQKPKPAQIICSFCITSLQGSLYCFLNNSIFQNEFFASVLTPSYTILLSKDVEINIKPCEITTKKYNSANNSLKNCKKERLLLSQKAFLFGGEAGI